MERDFKGVWIPNYIWLNENLSMLDKVLLVEIDSLDQSERGCFASNKYFAEFCGCSESAISKSISKLIKLGFIYYNNFNGRQRELKSRISGHPDFTTQPNKKYEADSQNEQSSLVKFTKQPSKIYEAASQNLLHNNIDNNIDNKEEKTKKIEKKEKESQNFITVIEDYIEQNKDRFNDPKEVEQRIKEAYNSFKGNAKDRIDIDKFIKALNNIFSAKRWASLEEIKRWLGRSIVFFENDDKQYNVWIQSEPNTPPKSFSFTGYNLRINQTAETYLKLLLKNGKDYCGWFDSNKDEVFYGE